MSRYHWIKTIVEDDNGELIIDLKEACEELGWKEGDGTESTWIDYDPDSAKGCANRKKYCTTQINKVNEMA